MLPGRSAESKTDCLAKPNPDPPQRPFRFGCALKEWVFCPTQVRKLPAFPAPLTCMNERMTVSRILCALVVMGFILSIHAQDLAIPDPGLNAAIRDALHKPGGALTEQDLLRLVSLIAGGRNIKRTDGLDGAANLNSLDLDSNSLTNFSLPGSLTKLQLLDVSFNSLAQCSIPRDLTNLETISLQGNLLSNFTLPLALIGLTELDLSLNELTSFTLPSDTTNLVSLTLFANQLTSLSFPENLNRLASLDLEANRLPALEFPSGLINLGTLILRGNQLTNLSFPEDMTNLTFVDIGENQLAALTMPAPLPKLSFLRRSANNLTSLLLPPGMTNLQSIFLNGNQLTNLTLPSGLTNLVQLDVRSNQLQTITLPPDVFSLRSIVMDGNPLRTLILSEVQAATQFAGMVANLRAQGVSIITYPVSLQLSSPRQTGSSSFAFTLTGPPGVYFVSKSSDLQTWNKLGTVTNLLGSLLFTDFDPLSAQKFYIVFSTNDRDQVKGAPPFGQRTR